MDFTKRDKKISRESAEEQFLKWLDAYDIDAYSFKESNPDEFERVERTYSNMISRIERGLISIEDDGEGGVNVVQYLKDDKVVYNHLTVRHLVARDRFEDHEMRKNALLAAMSGKPVKFFEDMKWGVDAKTADMVYTFFLLDY
jgi:hypothetical protein